MQLKDLSLFSLIKSKKCLKAFSKKPVLCFTTHHSCALFASILNCEDIKYFHITDTTKKRIANVPTEEIKGGKLIDLKSKPSCGLVFFNDGLHFIYLIRNNGVYIMTSRQKRKKVVDDPLFYTGEMISGFLYYDFFSDSEACFINNAIDCFNNKGNLLINEPYTRTIFKKMLNEAEQGKSELYNKYLADYQQKWSDTKICLQAFMFIHFAKVINTTRLSQEYDNRSFSEKIRSNILPQNLNIIQVDTFYDETMKVINPFSVTGHYRNQPIGKGRNETTLIYIDSFMKSGYTRIATKEKINI
jgi:hypothetical protein